MTSAGTVHVHGRHALRIPRPVGRHVRVGRLLHVLLHVRPRRLGRAHGRGHWKESLGGAGGGHPPVDRPHAPGGHQPVWRSGLWGHLPRRRKLLLLLLLGRLLAVGGGSLRVLGRRVLVLESGRGGGGHGGRVGRRGSPGALERGPRGSAPLLHDLLVLGATVLEPDLHLKAQSRRRCCL